MVINRIALKKNVKIKIIILNSIFVSFVSLLIIYFKKVILRDPKLAEIEFIFIFGLIILFLVVLNYFTKEKLNYLSGKNYYFGLRGWVATFLDYYFFILFNWSLMIHFFPVLDYMYSELAIASTVYFLIGYGLFGRSLGMFFTGLSIVDLQDDLKKTNSWKRAPIPGIMFLFSVYWIFGLVFYSNWVYLYWKFDNETSEDGKIFTLANWTFKTKTKLVKNKGIF